MTTDYPAYVPPRAASHRGRKTATIAIGVLLSLCCCLVVVAAVILFVDPFKLHLKDRIFGGTFDAAAEAMPGDTGIYVGFNLFGANPDDLDRLIKPFTEALDIDQRSWDDVLDELDKSLGEEMDITIRQDIQTWIGQYAGVGISELKFDEYGSLDQARLVVAVESRDNGAADRFLEKLQRYIEKNSGEEMSLSDYQGVVIYAMLPDGGQGIVFSRSGSLVLFGLDVDSLQGAIDAQKGGSLVDNQAYKDMVKQLPRKRVFTLYVNNEHVMDLFNAVQANTQAVYGRIAEELGGTAATSQPVSNEELKGWSDMIISLSIVDAGLQMDSVVTYEPDELSPEQLEAFKSGGKSPKTDDLLPEDTLFYLVGQRLDLGWKGIEDTLNTLAETQGGTNVDFQEALDQIEDETGVNLGDDLFRYLDGEYAIGVFPSSRGLIAEQGNIDLGFTFLAQASDENAIQDTMDKLTDTLVDQGALTDRSNANGMAITEFNESSGITVFATGVGEGYMVLGSSGLAIQGMFNGGDALAKSERYKEAVKALPNGMALVLYLDMDGLMGTIRENLPRDQRQSFDEATKIFESIPYIVAASSPLKNNIVRGTLIIYVK